MPLHMACVELGSSTAVTGAGGGGVEGRGGGGGGGGGDGAASAASAALPSLADRAAPTTVACACGSDPLRPGRQARVAGAGPGASQARRGASGAAAHASSPGRRTRREDCDGDAAAAARRRAARRWRMCVVVVVRAGRVYAAAGRRAPCGGCVGKFRRRRKMDCVFTASNSSGRPKKHTRARADRGTKSRPPPAPQPAPSFPPRPTGGCHARRPSEPHPRSRVRQAGPRSPTKNPLSDS
jgi:hypothetical protein